MFCFWTDISMIAHLSRPQATGCTNQVSIECMTTTKTMRGAFFKKGVICAEIRKILQNPWSTLRGGSKGQVKVLLTCVRPHYTMCH